MKYGQKFQEISKSFMNEVEVVKSSHDQLVARARISLDFG